MPKITLPVVGGSYQMPAIQLDAQTCINWYVTFDPTGKFPKALLPDPGLLKWTEVANAKSVRALFQLNDHLYTVVDNKFYRVDHNGNFHDLGSAGQPTLESSTGNVRIVPNETQLFLTDGKKGYVYQIAASAGKSAGDFYKIDTTNTVGPATFDGAGLDDMTSEGTFTGSADASYLVEIDGTPSGGPDTFKWSDNGGTTFNATGVAITGAVQTLNLGVQILFAHTTGHTKPDQWTFGATTDNIFYVPIIPAYQDGYGIYVKQVADRFYLSQIDNFAEVNALDSALSRTWPDHLVAAISIREELWLIGRQTTEPWYNTGQADFPFEPRLNLLIKYGTIAPYSLAVAHNNILLWLANNEEGGRVVVLVENYVPQIISTEPINAAIEGYENVENAIGGVYQWDGHIFYWITFPDDDRTWEYDLTTKLWHERRSTLQNTGPKRSDTRQGRWRVNNYAYFNGKHIFGDFESGKLYQLDRGTYTEDGTYMLRERTTRTLEENLHRICLYSLQLVMQQGVGLTSSSVQGHDPQVMLQISKDDGVTWGTELWKSMGKTGVYPRRIKWNMLGQSDSFVFRIRTTDPVYNVIIGSVIEAEDTET